MWSYLPHCPPPIGLSVIASWKLSNSGQSFILRHPLKRYVFERNRKWMEFCITSDFLTHFLQCCHKESGFVHILIGITFVTCQGLQQFESLMALTNLAQMSDEVR